MPEYKVVKEFNKFKPGPGTVTLPNELIGANQIDELLKSGHISGPPYASPAPENVGKGPEEHPYQPSERPNQNFGSNPGIGNVGKAPVSATQPGQPPVHPASSVPVHPAPAKAAPVKPNPTRGKRG